MAFTYKLKQGLKTVYIGVAKSPKKRAEQHKNAGKKFSSMQVTSKNIPRAKAEAQETRNLWYHRKVNGKNPKYNKTSNGKWRPFK
ncbi:MAG: hypothetical protein KC550_01045 [Nanoarchaeota archaeon]|nr:hypothetical protein [Nanoarchaeota archaeon]